MGNIEINKLQEELNELKPWLRKLEMAGRENNNL